MYENVNLLDIILISVLKKSKKGFDFVYNMNALFFNAKAAYVNIKANYKLIKVTRSNIMLNQMQI